MREDKYTSMPVHHIYDLFSECHVKVAERGEK